MTYSNHLITPSQAKGSHPAFLSASNEWPHWVHSLKANQNDGEGLWLLVTIGRKHTLKICLTPVQFALLMELCRFGINIVTNTNSPNGSPKAIIYAKIAFGQVPKDNLPLVRFLCGADPWEEVTRIEDRYDLRPSNLLKELTYSQPRKDGQEVPFRHAQRRASQALAKGEMPNGVTVESYMNNLRALWEAAQVPSESQEVAA